MSILHANYILQGRYNLFKKFLMPIHQSHQSTQQLCLFNNTIHLTRNKCNRKYFCYYHIYHNRYEWLIHQSIIPCLPDPTKESKQPQFGTQFAQLNWQLEQPISITSDWAVCVSIHWKLEFVYKWNPQTLQTGINVLCIYSNGRVERQQLIPTTRRRRNW